MLQTTPSKPTVKHGGCILGALLYFTIDLIDLINSGLPKYNCRSTPSGCSSTKSRRYLLSALCSAIHDQFTYSRMHTPLWILLRGRFNLSLAWLATGATSRNFDVIAVPSPVIPARAAKMLELNANSSLRYDREDLAPVENRAVRRHCLLPRACRNHIL